MPFFRARPFCLRSSLIAVPVLVSCTAATADLVNRWEIGSGDATAMVTTLAPTASPLTVTGDSVSKVRELTTTEAPSMLS